MKTLTRLFLVVLHIVAILVIPVERLFADEPSAAADRELQEALAQLDTLLTAVGDGGTAAPDVLSQLNGLDDKFKQLQESLARRDAALEASAEMLTEAEARLANLGDENQILKDELEKQHQRVEQAENARRQAQADFERLFKGEGKSAKQAAGSEDARVRELEAAVEDMRDVDAQRKAAMDDLFKQLAAQKKQIAAREQTQAETQAALESEKARVTELERELATRDETLAARQQELADRQQQLEALEGTLAGARRQVESSAATLAERETELQALRGEFEQIKLVDAQRRKTLDETLASLAVAEQSVKILTADLNEALAQHKAYADETAAKLSTLTARNALLEGEITRMEQDVTVAQADRDAALAQVADLAETRKTRDATVADLESQVARLSAVDAQRRKAMDQILLDTATLEQDKSRLELEVQRLALAAETAKAESSADPAAGGDDQVRSANAALLARVAELERALQAAREAPAVVTDAQTMTHELSLAQQNAQELAARVKELESRKTDVRESDLFKELEKINAMLREKMLEVEADRQRLAKLAEGAAQTEAAQTQAIETHTARLAEMDNALTEAQAREGEYKELIERLVPQVATLEQQVTTLTQERQELTNRLLQRDEDLQALKVELERREHRLAKAERVADVLEKARTEVLRAGEREKLNMHYNMASVYAREGKFTEAENEYLQALRIDPTDADVHYNLGILYDDEMKQSEKAMVHYRRYLQLSPHGPDADRVRNWLMKLEMQAQR